MAWKTDDWMTWISKPNKKNYTIGDEIQKNIKRRSKTIDNSATIRRHKFLANKKSFLDDTPMSKNDKQEIMSKLSKSLGVPTDWIDHTYSTFSSSNKKEIKQFLNTWGKEDLDYDSLSDEEKANFIVEREKLKAKIYKEESYTKDHDPLFNAKGYKGKSFYAFISSPEVKKNVVQ